MANTTPAMFSLAGRTALVTGGTSGIGRMIAEGLLGAGARVLIVGRDAAKTAAIANELDPGGACIPVAADVTRDDGREALVERARAEAPDLSILVNNAGITAHAPYGSYPASHFDEVMSLNVKAPFLIAQALHPVLKANASDARPAHVINIGSVAALMTTTPDSYAYGPSKAAVHHMTRVLARKLAPDRICVNAIAPGLFPSRMSAWITEDAQAVKAMTERIPMGRLGEPGDIAALAVYVASSRYLTGAVIPLDGGMAL
jgi:NAD(P)-dependent dehydrogenase (short-subunit alcohol dehydrogenase family)